VIPHILHDMTFHIITPFPVSEQLHCGCALTWQTKVWLPRLSGGSAEYATLPWPARPKKHLLPRNPAPGYRQDSRDHAYSAKFRLGFTCLITAPILSQPLSLTRSEPHWTAQSTLIKCSYGRWLTQTSLVFSGWANCYLRAQSHHNTHVRRHGY